MSLDSGKPKKNDDFDIIKSQLEDLKNLVDSGKDKSGSEQEKKQQEPDNQQRKEQRRDDSNLSDTDGSDNEEAVVDGNLLNSLSNDVDNYHRKVQLKKEKSHIKKEKIIAKELEKKRNHDDSGIDKTITDAANAVAVATAGHGEENGDSHNFDEDSDEENDLDDIDDEDDDAQAFSGLPIEVTLKGRKGRPASKKRKVNRSKKIYPWTKAEDEAIVYYKEDQKYSWKKIEEQLDYRHTWQAIQMRYLRNHKSRNEEWSRFMEVKLINAIRKDWESRWKRIGADLGKDFSSERCIQKNMEICKRMDMDYVKTIFENKEIISGYKNPFNDIKDAEAHKKLMLVYMGLDAITYEDSEEEEEEPDDTNEDNDDGRKTLEQNEESIQNEQEENNDNQLEKGV